MVNDYIQDKVSYKVKETIGIVKFDETKFLIDTDDKFLDFITLKNVAILITYIMKDDGKSYPHILFERAFIFIMNKHTTKHLK